MAHAYVLGLAEWERRMRRSIRKRELRSQLVPWDISDSEFITKYRISLNIFHNLVDELRPHMPPTQRSTSISVENKIMAALNFYAGGSYQKRVGEDYNLGLSQTSVHKCVAEVTEALNQREILSKYIKFPCTREDRIAVMKGFMETSGFPGVVGCIDGTHIAIIRPQEYEEAFVNIKHYHSINAMIICDAHLNIIHVDASYGGASHDSYIWNRSALESHMQSLSESGEACWLLGDSGYEQCDWLMTPILSTTPNSPEAHYTDMHTTTRNTVERCIGLLKARWQCLLAHKKLHYDPVKAGKIVNACVVLHNICNSAGIAAPAIDANDVKRDSRRQPSQPVYDVNEISRQSLVARLWKVRQKKNDGDH